MKPLIPQIAVAATLLITAGACSSNSDLDTASRDVSPPITRGEVEADEVTPAGETLEDRDASRTTTTTEAAQTEGTITDPLPADHVFELETEDSGSGPQVWRFKVLGVAPVSANPDSYESLYDDSGTEIPAATKVRILAEYVDGPSSASISSSLYWQAFDGKTKNEIPSAYGVATSDIHQEVLPGGSYEADLLLASEHPEDIIMSWRVAWTLNDTQLFQTLAEAPGL